MKSPPDTRKPQKAPSGPGRAVRLLVQEIMNIQTRAMIETPDVAVELWHSLQRFATNPDASKALE